MRWLRNLGVTMSTCRLQKRRELALDADEVETGNVAGLKLHEHVDVAVRAEIVSQDRAEER
jgi:hypothetical protein